MFFLYLTLPLLVLSVLAFICQRVMDKRQPLRSNDYETKNSGGWEVVACIGVVVSVLFLGLALVVSLFANSNQQEDGVELKKIDQFEKTYQARADNLSKQFASYLLEAYPKHEQDIFAKIEPGKLDIYLVKYPELQASKTILALVDQTRSLQDEIYNQRLARAQKINDMRYRLVNPWIFHWMLPSIEIPEK